MQTYLAQLLKAVYSDLVIDKNVLEILGKCKNCESFIISNPFGELITVEFMNTRMLSILIRRLKPTFNFLVSSGRASHHNLSYINFEDALPDCMHQYLGYYE